MNKGDALECLKCGHKWEQKGEEEPGHCPKCTSTTWDEKDRRKNPHTPTKPVGVKGNAGARQGHLTDLTGFRRGRNE